MLLLSNSFTRSSRLRSPFSPSSLRLMHFLLQILAPFVSATAFHDSSYSLRMTSSSLYKPLPVKFKLTNVIVINRHGDRSQIAKGFGRSIDPVEDEGITSTWKTKLLSPETIRRLSIVANTPRSETELADVYDGWDVKKYPYGMLTEEGAQQLIRIGQELRARYLGTFLPTDFTNDHLYLRSTKFCRTRQSLRSILVGLHGIDDNNCSPINPSEIYSRPKHEETMYPQADGPCPAMGARRTELFSDDFIAKNWPGFQEMEGRFKKLLNYSEPINWLTVREILVCQLSHNIPLPEGLSPQDVAILNSFSGWLWGVLYKDSSLNRLAIGRFFRELLEDVKNAMEGSTEHKMLFYSGHDSTLVPVACALGIHDDEWPVYAANIVIEIAKEIDTGNDFVRVFYNFHEMILPDCSEPWCPYGSFQKRLADLIPTDYVTECQCEGVDAAAMEDEIRATLESK
eukprot:gene11897-24927_t